MRHQLWQLVLAGALLFGWFPQEYQFFDDSLGDEPDAVCYLDCSYEYSPESEPLDFEGAHELFDEWVAQAEQNPPQLVIGR